MRSRSQTQTRLVSKLSEKVTSKCCKFSFILFCVWLLFCSAGLSVLSDFANVSLRKRERESWLLYLNCVLAVMWQVVLCVSFPRSCELVCGLIVAFPCHTHLLFQ